MNSFRLKSYFTFLGRNKLFTSINLFGFAVSLAVVILLGLYIKKEMSVDSTVPDKERIYRLTREDNTFAPLIAADIKNRYPDQIEAITRIKAREETVWVDKEILKPRSLLVDSSFFSVFQFPLLEGDPQNQLRAMNEVTVTRSFANKLFGSESALGKSFRLGTLEMIVTGVMKDLDNSHFKNPDMLMRFEHMGTFDNYDSWFCYIYIKAVAGTDLPTQMPDMKEYFATYLWPYQNDVFKILDLMPLTECYWNHGVMYGDAVFRTESRTFINVLLAAMITILLFAVINYINLSIAQSGFRAKEAATRRLLGSSQAGLFGGFIAESVVFCAEAFVVGVVLAMVAQPAFNKLLGTEISVQDAFTATNMVFAAVAIAVLGFICGTAPAWVISEHKPVEVVRGSFARKTKMVYSRVLIVFQYAVTIVLLGATITIMFQTRFMRTTDLGFNKENIVYIFNNSGLTNEQTSALRDRLSRIAGVEAVTFGYPPLFGGGNTTVNSGEEERPVSFQIFSGDSLYMDFWGIEPVRQTGLSGIDAVWLNETAAREIGLTDDATSFKFGNLQPHIAGVVKDFHFRDFTQNIGPVIIMNLDYSVWGIFATAVKISGTDQIGTYKRIQEVYVDFTNGIPFEGGFIDATVKSAYDAQQRTYTIIGSFAVIAILIAALGMLAMATYYLRQRTAEIAVRKVFGSTNGEILRNVILNFMRMVLIAFVVAVPVIWYAMSRWLEGYVYRISISWTIFALAGLVAFAIALLAVFWQSWKATTANPVDSLKR